MSTIPARLAALQAQEHTLPLAVFAEQLKELHLAERAEINAAWTSIAHEKAAHVAERTAAQKRLADAKRRQAEAANHIVAAQRRLESALRQVGDVEAEIASTDARIAELARNIESGYVAMSAHRARPAYDCFADFMSKHPELSPSSRRISLPPSPEAKALDKCVLVQVVEVFSEEEGEVA